MDNNKAKLILSVYRPSGADASDPFFKEALEQAAKDPQLSAWLAGEQQFDAAFVHALGSVKAPEAGRTMIMAMAHAPVRSRAWMWWPVAIAASIALLITAGVVLRQPSRLALPERATLAELASNLSEHHASIGLMSPDLVRLRSWIDERGGPLPERIPPGLEKLAVLGCQTWNTSAGKVSLICFVGESMETVHLYIFENPDQGLRQENLPGIDSPRMLQQGAWSFAIWKDKGRGHVLGVPSKMASPEKMAAYFSI